MKKQLRLSKAIFDKKEKMTIDEMKNVKGESLASDCCRMFCSVCGDSICELIYFEANAGETCPCG